VSFRQKMYFVKFHFYNTRLTGSWNLKSYYKTPKIVQHSQCKETKERRLNSLDCHILPNRRRTTTVMYLTVLDISQMQTFIMKIPVLLYRDKPGCVTHGYNLINRLCSICCPFQQDKGKHSRGHTKSSLLTCRIALMIKLSLHDQFMY
jgi:hypothetical protein